MRWIAHIDMDAFYASVEMRDHPPWRGQPLVVAYPGARSVVCAASYEARKFGIRSAQPLVRALQLCPNLIVAPPRMSLYARISRSLRELYSEYTPRVEPLALDECYLELDHETPGQTLLQIRNRIARQLKLPASAGIGPNKFIAKLASGLAKPRGQILINPQQVCDFLWPLPIEKLWGVGPVTARKMRSQGWHTIQQIAEEDPQRLTRVLGKAAHELREMAWGRDSRAVEARQQIRSLSAEHTFEHDQNCPETLTNVLQAQAEELEGRLQQSRLLTRRVVVKIRWPDFRNETRTLRCQPPSDRAEDFWGPAWDYLKQRLSQSGQRVRLLGLGVSDLISSDAPLQLGLFDEAL